MIYMFDVDGTIAPSSFQMAPEMVELMLAFTQQFNVYLNTGSDAEKMKWQVPEEVRANCLGLFPVLGGEFWKEGQRLYQNTFKWPEGLKEAIEQELAGSNCPQKCGDHMQDRGSMLCISTVGKDADKAQRADYIAFDQVTKEREGIAKRLTENFDGLMVEIGGETSINISNKGGDKSQILTYLREATGAPITHFADKMEQGGTDYPLAQALSAEGSRNQNIQVSSWQDTKEKLEKIMKEKAQA